ncbi:hypothetical protein, partial [Enterococcus faecalis]|uniref:hypothetical protein n=1 Tax=Enterococcus faecalis TaxID=1351 RepID=UPI002FDC4265
MKQIYHFVVILDATPIQSIQIELQKENKDIVPIFTLYNLTDILEKLSFISEKVDYFIKRCAIEKSCRYIGEEEDFISAYRMNGLNTDKYLYEDMDYNSVK